MITGEHGVIRTAEQDDAVAMKRLYASPLPRSALLDRKRELLVPTLDELRELLNHKDAKRAGVFYTIEDRCGAVRGFCSLRGAHPEVAYAEFVVMFFEEADYANPMAGEAFEFLAHRGFVQMRLNKLAAQRLEWETAYRAFLVRHGFEGEGVQRDIAFACGRYHDQESLSLLRHDYEAAPAAPPA